MTFREQLIANMIPYYLAKYGDIMSATRVAISSADRVIKELAKG